MNYLDLFSGIGGFALGAYWADMRFENHYFSEIEPFAVDLYQKRFPDAIPLGDIKEIDCEKIMADTHERSATREIQTRGDESTNGGRDWIITGGFPCQDISVAGKGAGIRGSRSGLWFEYWRIIRDLRPRYAIMENVGAITFRGLTDVVGSLAEIGYDAEWQDIRASDVGAPHKRERIWIVAYPRQQPKGSKSDGFDRGYLGGNTPGIRTETRDGLANSDEEMADTVCNSTEPRLSNGSENEMGKSATHTELERPDWWAIEPDVGRLANGIPRRVDRLKGLGNAIVPQIAQLLFEQIRETYDEN